MAELMFESWAIIAIMGAFVVAFLRTKRYEYAISVWPLALVPFSFIVSSPISRWVAGQFQYPESIVRVLMIVGCLAVCCAVTALFAGWIANRKTRRMFLWMAVGFNFLLTCIYISEILR